MALQLVWLTWPLGAAATEAAPEPAPVAGLVAGVSGKVTVTRARAQPREARTPRAAAGVLADGAERPVVLLDGVDAHDSLSVAEGATLWLLERPSTLWRLAGPGVYALGERGVTTLSAGPTAAVPSSLELTGLTESDEERGPSWQRQVPVVDQCPLPEPEGRDLSPRETAVRSRRPTLSWLVRGGARRHLVATWRLGPEGSLVPLERWDNVETPALTPWLELAPGSFVTWTVRGQGGDGSDQPPESTWLYVMTDAEIDAADADLRAISAARPGLRVAAEALDLIEAWTLQRHGLLDEALEHYRHLLARQARRDPGLVVQIEALERRVLTEPRARRARALGEEDPREPAAGAPP
ncbi:MAG: hypothetical protein H6746_04670 [Deltaproteobacteria bacterium]|nr:hypothetical protein [Deltaproteobacteria bacterium]